MRSQVRDIDRPLFIVGSGRSGSTLLYRLLAVHPDLAWVSRLSDRFPCSVWAAFAQRLLGLPVLGRLARERIIRRGAWMLTPVEGVHAFEEHVGLRDDRRSTDADYDAAQHARMDAVLRAHSRGSGRRRFLCKRTANAQRIALLNRMYPEALFLHLIRDGRAVAYSLAHVWWWDDVDIWWLGQRPPQWRAAGRDPLELTALHWRHDTEEVLAAAPLLGQRYREIRYEDLVRDPRATLQAICAFAGYSFTPAYRDLVPGTLPDMDQKWRTGLDHQQQRVVEQAVGGLLAQLGYAK